jgi:putative lysine transport system permease protein
MDRIVELGQDIVKLWNVYSKFYLDGIYNTLILALVATFFGCVIGLLCGVLNTIPYGPKDNIVKKVLLRIVRIVVRVYVEVFRGTPMVLQAVFVYYGLPYFTHNQVAFAGNSGIWLASIIVVSVNTGAYMAESVRGGIISIDPGQIEGAKAIGMNHVQTMVHVIMPQALRNIMPQIGNNFIINIKDTSVMFIIGFMDFFAKHKFLVGLNGLYFPSAVIEMAGYLTLTLTASLLLRFVEKLMDGRSSYKLVQTDSLTMTAGTYSHPDREPFAEQSRELAHHEAESKRERIRQELKYGTTKGDR